MLDLETLSVFPNSVILSLGAVKFDPHRLVNPVDFLELQFDADQQIANGRHVDPGTLQWWGQQKPQVIEAAMNPIGRLSVESALTSLTKFVFHADEIWCQGPVFDIVILENIYQQYGMSVPWQYWKIRDSRTLFSSLNYDPRRELRLSGADHHNALDDAIIQAVAVQQVYRLLKDKKVLIDK